MVNSKPEKALVMRSPVYLWIRFQIALWYSFFFQWSSKDIITLWRFNKAISQSGKFYKDFSTLSREPLTYGRDNCSVVMRYAWRLNQQRKHVYLRVRIYSAFEVDIEHYTMDYRYVVKEPSNGIVRSTDESTKYTDKALHSTRIFRNMHELQYFLNSDFDMTIFTRKDAEV